MSSHCLNQPVRSVHLAIADLAGGDWPDLARQASLYFTAQAAEADQESSLGIELLKDIEHYLTSFDGDFIPSQQLLSGLKLVEDDRWFEMELSMRQLALLLKPYDVQPVSNGQLRGYKVVKLKRACERWLTPSTPLAGTSDGAPRIQEE